jgi:[acyl-carrier-protein] S-malonyltransferase
MAKLALLFPGQGAQAVGMGLEVARAFPRAARAMAESDDALGFPLSRLCFDGPAEELLLTANTQPAILAVSIAILRVLEAEGVAASYAAGLSLGEYSALVAAGALPLGAALLLVQKRGRYMQEAVAPGDGAMAAIMGLDEAAVGAACAAAAQETGGAVTPANFNCPAQIVVSGHSAAVAAAAEKARAAGARSVRMLQVSAPFHCSLMAPAAARLEPDLLAAPFAPARFPVVANAAARPVTDPGEVRSLLVLQVTSPVRWEASMRFLLAAGVDLFFEVGPGKALSGFMRRIDENARVVNIQTPADIQVALDSYREVC